MIKANNTYEIRKYTESDYNAFKDMFSEYFLKDFKINMKAEELENVCTDITRYVHAGIQFLDLSIQNDVPKGFVIYQIDSSKSDWCEKEGYGFIREVFVVPDARKYGIGRRLVMHAEEKLYELMALRIYLTSDESGDFWHAMGYCESGEISTINNDPIFIK